MVVLLIVGLAIVALVASASGSPAGAPRHITIKSSYPAFTLRDIAERADAVAILEFNGTSRAFWNSADNKEWEPQIASGKRALIYRDDVFAVRKVLRGSLAESSLTVRGVGGTIANVTVEHEEQLDWVAGRSYLVFLRQDDTPFREGSERAWTVVWLGHGALESDGPGRWSNADGTLALTETELADLR